MYDVVKSEGGPSSDFAPATNIKTDSENQVVSGPEVTFTLVPAKPNTPRALTIDLSMNRATTGEQTCKFGDGGELRIHGERRQVGVHFPERIAH
jgi:hypothetical protein